MSKMKKYEMQPVGPADEKAADTEVVGSDPARENWTGKMDFLLSCIGYAVGLGTIWRFPYLCYRNGGGAFLIPYVIYLFLMGMPLVLLEMSYGQFSNLSPISVWRMCPLFTGIGYGMVIISALTCIYYNVIICWTLYYLVMSFTSELPWSHCNNTWNTPACSSRYDEESNNITRVYALAGKTVSIAGDELASTNASVVLSRTPSEEFWERYVLGIPLTGGIDNMGAPRWQLVISLLVAWIFIFLCLCKGVKVSGKVVYVTATLPYVLLIAFLIRSVTLPGASQGIYFYIVPDWEKLLTFQPWGDAAMQLFYSMGAAWGALVTMASYNKFNNNFYRDAIIVSFTDTLTAFLAGFVIFATIGFMSDQTGVAIADVVTEGPGLVFVVYPEAITQMPIAPLWAIIFFIFLFTVGVDSQFGMFETVLSALFDEYPKLRNYKIAVTGVLSVIEFSIGLLCVTNGGIYFLQIMDWYCSTFSLMILSFTECLVIMWIYGANRFYDDMRMMLGYRPFLWWKIAWMFVTPGLIGFIFVFAVVNHKAVTYGDYEYPAWAIAIGWLFALCSILPLPVIAVIKVLGETGPLKQRLYKLTRPAPDWGPAESSDCREFYSAADGYKFDHAYRANALQ